MVARIDISELVPGDMNMVTSSSCLRQGVHGIGDRQTGREGGLSLGYFRICTSS